MENKGEMYSVKKSGKRNQDNLESKDEIKPFIAKLLKMVSNADNSDVVYWTDDDNGFEIKSKR